MLSSVARSKWPKPGRRTHRSRQCTPGRARIRGRGGPRLPQRIAQGAQTLLALALLALGRAEKRAERPKRAKPATSPAKLVPLTRLLHHRLGYLRRAVGFRFPTHIGYRQRATTGRTGR